MNFSKSRYASYRACPKQCWLKLHKPEEERISADTLSRMKTGSEAGELARGLFGEYALTEIIVDGKQNLPAMIERTKELMIQNTPVICEAAFNYNGLYCAVDILKRVGDGWAIYEVKSTTEGDDRYIPDVAYQKYVLEMCGVIVSGVYLVHLNKDYVRRGALDLQELFKCDDWAEKINDEYAIIESVLEQAGLFLNGGEPGCFIGKQCLADPKCSFCDYCFRDMPQLSVFKLYNFRRKISCFNRGIISFEDILNSGEKLTEVQRRQIEFALEGVKSTYIDKQMLRLFLSALSYPLYFLDFETEQSAIPKYDFSSPYDQIPFQYSSHYIEREGGELKHREFLGDSINDPRRALVERLVEDIPKDVCVVAYHSPFEKERLKELAQIFPDLAEHLLNIMEHIVDLKKPFTDGYYYNAAMGSSFSIKSVLPAVFPDDPELNYHNLEGVHNGSEAMNIYPEIAKMPPEEAAKARENLLKYCALDTFAMVKLWQKLVEVSK